jgi:hypothetical protein
MPLSAVVLTLMAQALAWVFVVVSRWLLVQSQV